MPRTIQSLSRKVLTISAVASLLIFTISPAIGLAQETNEDTSPTTSNETNQTNSTETTNQSPDSSVSTPTQTAEDPQLTAPDTGPPSPTGADAPSYQYNPATGNWENGVYSWNPNTGKTTTLVETDYSYNPETGRWDTTAYQYQPSSNTYEPVPISVAKAPQGTTVGNLGPDSNTELGLNVDRNFEADVVNNLVANNNILSNATTGNVILSGNTTAGNATSGNATAQANVVNVLQTAWDPTNELLTFTANLDGDVYGDLVVNPYALGPNSNLVVDKDIDTDIKLNVENNADINNNIELNARSGDVEVSQNTTAGDATSGNALAMANIMNVINSAINSGGSFIGNININGSLEGDILLPQGFIDTIVQNTGPDSTVELTKEQKAQLELNINDDVAINNDINASAMSGAVDVGQNTNSGNATSGNALTDITILNLTGKQIIGANSLLVFVNVGGEWVGLIMDAAPGTNAAILGSGPNSTITASDNTNTNLNANIDNNFTINNILDLDATSGNVTAIKNSNVGDATSGDAAAIANITNITDSYIDLSGWLGILYINILGDWRGSFGVDTPYGDPIASNAGGGVGGVPQSLADQAIAELLAQQPNNQQYQAKVFSFNATSGGSSSGSRQASSAASVVASVKEAVESSAVRENTLVTTSANQSIGQSNSKNVLSSTNSFPALRMMLFSAVAFVVILAGEKLVGGIRYYLF